MSQVLSLNTYSPELLCNYVARRTRSAFLKLKVNHHTKFPKTSLPLRWSSHHFHNFSIAIFTGEPKFRLRAAILGSCEYLLLRVSSMKLSIQGAACIWRAGGVRINTGYYWKKSKHNLQRQQIRREVYTYIRKSGKTGIV